MIRVGGEKRMRMRKVGDVGVGAAVSVCTYLQCVREEIPKDLKRRRQSRNGMKMNVGLGECVR